VPGASKETQRVKIANANWVPGPERADGEFRLQLITSDGRRHALTPSPAAMTALIGLIRADAVLAWDPQNRTLIAANLVGTMPWTEATEPDSRTER
jgi:hypothetical protein